MNAVLDANVATHYAQFTHGRNNVEHRSPRAASSTAPSAIHSFATNGARILTPACSMERARELDDRARLTRSDRDTRVLRRDPRGRRRRARLSRRGRSQAHGAHVRGLPHELRQLRTPKRRTRVEQLLAAANSPPTFALSAVRTASNEQHRDYARAIDRSSRRSRREISPESLRALESTDVGRGYKSAKTALVS